MDREVEDMDGGKCTTKYPRNATYLAFGDAPWGATAPCHTFLENFSRAND